MKLINNIVGKPSSAWLLALFFCLPVFSTPALAVDIKVNCNEVQDPDSPGETKQQCVFESGSATREFVETVSSLVDALQQDTNGEEICKRNGNVVTCTLPTSQKQLTCDVTEGNSTADCDFPEMAEYFDIGCSVDQAQNSGSCTFASNDEIIQDDVNALIATGMLNANQMEVGSSTVLGCALRAGTNEFQRDCDTLLSLLSSGDNEEAAAIIEEVTPNNVDVAIDNSAYQLTLQLDGIAGRMSRLRQNQRGLDVAGFQLFDGTQWINGGMLMASNNDAAPAVSFADSRLGVFIDGALLTGSQDQDDDGMEGETDYDGQTVTLGIDYRISDQMIAGVAYSLAFTQTDFANDRGSLDADGYTLLGYTTFYRDAWYVEGTLALGSDRYEQERRMICTTAECGIAFDVLADAEYYGDQTAITLSGGYAFTFGAITLTPNAQWSLLNLDTDAYRETTDSTGAGSGFLLDIDDQSRDHSTLSVGVDASYAISTGFGIVVPHASLDLRNELDDDAMTVNGQFVGDTANDQAFSLTARELDSSYFVVGAGTSLQLTGGNSAFLDVKTLVGYEDLDQWQVRAGWRWEM